MIIVEHAQSTANAARIIQGHLDSKLSDLGREQAKKVALRLKSEKIDLAYSSDLERAKDTAEEILKYHPDVRLVCLRELRERAKGAFEGEPKDEKYKEIEKLGLSYYEFDFEGGERSIELQRRIVDFYNIIISRYSDKNMLVVSHGETISSLLLHLYKEPFENNKKYVPKNGAITIIDVNDSGEHEVRLLNDLAHLG